MLTAAIKTTTLTAHQGVNEFTANYPQT